MKFKTILLALCAILTIWSCKKDDNDKYFLRDTFKGYLSISNMPAYVAPNEVITLKADSLKANADTTIIEYIWSIKKLKLEGEGQTWQFTVPDTLGTYTIRCAAVAYNYSPFTNQQQFTIISNKSLIINNLPTNIKEFTDTRDNHTYKYITIDNKDWMIENLNYSNGNIGASFNNSRAIDNVYGRYYNWEEAQQVCPQGWRLPSNKDLQDLASQEHIPTTTELQSINNISGCLMADATLNNEVMWQYFPAVQKTNSIGLSIIPTGYVFNNDKLEFKGNLEYAAFWTADQANEKEAYYRYIYQSNPNLLIAKGSKTNLYLPIRCVRAHQQ